MIEGKDGWRKGGREGGREGREKARKDKIKVTNMTANLPTVTYIA